MGLIWLSYFDPRKEYKTVWWRSGDLTETRIDTPCRDWDALRMKRPLKGRFYEFFKLLCHI
jgi:hypothetical protein